METNHKLEISEEKKAILVDLDGTIVDTEKLDDIAMQIVLKRNRILHVKKFIGCTLDKYIENTTKDTKLQEKIKREFIREYEHILRNTELKANYNLLNILKKGCNLKVALVTSNNKRLTMLILAKLGIKSFFDVIITCEDVKNHKPHPEPYLKALEKLKVHPINCIAFEDTEEGLQSAKSAGLDSQKIIIGERR